MKFLKRLFGGRNKGEVRPSAFSDEEFNQHYEQKKQGLERILGPMYEYVGHAIMPFSVGGSVDMYYFPNHKPGTAFVTMELIQPDGSGPVANWHGTYEFVAFSKHQLSNSEDAKEFNSIERRLCGIFTKIVFYAFDAKLNPNDTCEVPNDDKPNNSIIFSKYDDFSIGDSKHHLLLCIEVFASELAFARENSTSQLIEKLRDAGHYPYSDLDRLPVA